MRKREKEKEEVDIYGKCGNAAINPRRHMNNHWRISPTEMTSSREERRWPAPNSIGRRGLGFLANQLIDLPRFSPVAGHLRIGSQPAPFSLRYSLAGCPQGRCVGSTPPTHPPPIITRPRDLGWSGNQYKIRRRGRRRRRRRRKKKWKNWICWLCFFHFLLFIQFHFYSLAHGKSTWNRPGILLESHKKWNPFSNRNGFKGPFRRGGEGAETRALFPGKHLHRQWNPVRMIRCGCGSFPASIQRENWVFFSLFLSNFPLFLFLMIKLPRCGLIRLDRFRLGHWWRHLPAHLAPFSSSFTAASFIPKMLFFFFLEIPFDSRLIFVWVVIGCVRFNTAPPTVLPPLRPIQQLHRRHFNQQKSNSLLWFIL